MVLKGSGEERGATPAPASMATSPERPNPLHNFMLPSTLKWGSQRHLRCKKSSTTGNNVFGTASRSDESTARVSRMMKKPQIHDDDGIDAVRERLVLDLKAAADKMKNVMLRNKEEEEGEDEEEEGEGVKPWKLRTRKEEFKAKVAAGGSGKGLKIEEKKPNRSSPMRGNGNGNGGAAKLPNLRSNSEKTLPRLKFSVQLTKKEIEEDFIAMTGQKPPKKPVKRPKAVQKQVDTLLPGSWLGEVSADSYKVPEAPGNNGKAFKGKGKIHLSDSDEE